MVIDAEPMSLRAAAAAFLKTWDSVQTGAAAAVIRARILDLRCALAQPDAAAVGSTGNAEVSNETPTPSPDVVPRAMWDAYQKADSARR
jgi:hypothetical protein